MHKVVETLVGGHWFW